MNFNPMGFLIGREMAKRELGSGKEDRANQLGLVGAMTPSPMMGAVMAMVIARNEGPSSSTTSAPLGPPPTSGPAKQPPALVVTGPDSSGQTVIIEDRLRVFVGEIDGASNSDKTIPLTFSNDGDTALEFTTDIVDARKSDGLRIEKDLVSPLENNKDQTIQVRLDHTKPGLHRLIYNLNKKGVPGDTNYQVTFIGRVVPAPVVSPDRPSLVVMANKRPVEDGGTVLFNTSVKKGTDEAALPTVSVIIANRGGAPLNAVLLSDDQSNGEIKIDTDLSTIQSPLPKDGDFTVKFILLARKEGRKCTTLLIDSDDVNTQYKVNVVGHVVG